MKKFLFLTVLAFGVGMYFSHELTVMRNSVEKNYSKASAVAGDAYDTTTKNAKAAQETMERTQNKLRKAYNALNPND